MAILSILKYPDGRLRIIASPVGHVDKNIRQLVGDMAQTMYAAPGIGLAATQVNVHKQMIVIDISETKDNLLVLINPRIVESTGQQQFEEGCLSVPGIYEAVIRAENIFVKALDKEGKAFNLRADGLLSVCIQHEMDHLKGRVFIEYLSQLKQTRIRQKLKKMARVTL